MKARWKIFGLAVLLVLSLAGGGAYLLWSGANPVSEGMPVPGLEGVEETIVGSEMPVPGLEGVEEMIVGSEMPVPGLGDVEEMIVSDDQ